MPPIDYNGPSPWSRAEILERYARYAAEAGHPPRDLAPVESTDRRGVRRIHPVMDRVIAGIAAGDLACVRLGLELVEEDARMPFGRTLKSNAARALRQQRAFLTQAQESRVRRRVIAMLRAGHVPREFREYAKLARAIGLDPATLPSTLPDDAPDNPHVARHLAYLRAPPPGARCDR